MPDLQKLQENKNKIISSIKLKGPSFPTRISRETGISPLFASAYLSELVYEKKLKLSNMKIGSSPLYFIEGQEQELENFIEYLNHKEKEAFLLLKDSHILEDEAQEPSIRVAIRKIKDFASPVTVKIKGESKLFWKYFALPQDKVTKKIQENIITNKSIPDETHIKKIEPIFTKKIRKIKEIPDYDFSKSVKKHLLKNNMEILNIITEKKREFISKIRVNSNFGSQEFLLISKDKKKITENDLTIALQKSQTEKMPALFLSPGEFDKKSKSYSELWRNLLKVDKIDI